MTKILIVVGVSGSGKSVVANFLAKKLKAKLIRVGDLVDSFKSISKNKKLFFKNDDQLDLLLLNQILPCDQIVVVDGVREPRLITLFKCFGKNNVFVLTIDCTFNHVLLHSRGLNEKQIKQKLERDKKLGLFECMKLADCTIENKSSEKNLLLKSLEVTKKWLEKKK